MHLIECRFSFLSKSLGKFRTPAVYLSYFCLQKHSFQGSRNVATVRTCKTVLKQAPNPPLFCLGGPRTLTVSTPIGAPRLCGSTHEDSRRLWGHWSSMGAPKRPSNDPLLFLQKIMGRVGLGEAKSASPRGQTGDLRAIFASPLRRFSKLTWRREL